MFDVPATDTITEPVANNMPEDIEYLGDKLGAILRALVNLNDAVVQQQRPAPSMFFAMTTHNDFPQSVRTRLTDLIVSASAACTVSVKVGTATFMQFDMATAGVVALPFPTNIAEGNDVAVTVSAGTLRLAVFLGYTETRQPNV